MPPIFTPESLDRVRDAVVGWLPHGAAGLGVFVAVWLLSHVAEAAVRRLGRTRRVDPTLIRFLGKTLRLGLVVLGVVAGLGTAGVDVGALVAGLGLTGFALGFALKDIVSNLLAGVLVILYRTFDEGDRIKVAGFEGRVRTIDLRYTLLETGSDVVFLPNQLLFNNAVVVLGTEPGSGSEAAAAAQG